MDEKLNPNKEESELEKLIRNRNEKYDEVLRKDFMKRWLRSLQGVIWGKNEAYLEYNTVREVNWVPFWAMQAWRGIFFIILAFACSIYFYIFVRKTPAFI
jgi:hypothetical protein